MVKRRAIAPDLDGFAEDCCFLSSRAVARLAGYTFVAVLMSSVAAADEPAKVDASPLLITLGSYGVYGPRFEGSKRHDIGPWPIISWREQGSKEWLDLPTDGLDFSLIETDNFRLGPVGYWRWQRDNATIPLRGFSRIGSGHSSIDLSLEGGIFAEYWPMQWLRTRVEARESLVGAAGLVANFSSDVVWRPTSEWTFSTGPRLSLADARFMQDYYGVNAAQSFKTGLPTYSASGGLRSYGANAYTKYMLSPSWAASAFVDYQRLSGSADDSPIINVRGSHEQYMVGLGLSYTFKAPW